MKIVLQRVNSASVSVDGEVVGSIGRGVVAFLGVAKTDEKENAAKLSDKIFRLRIFADENGKTNLSAKDVDGEILIVSQFTLNADLSSNRPSFSGGASPDKAKELYEHFIDCCKEKFTKTQTGKFAHHMHVLSSNDGPFTLVLEG